MKNTLLTLGYRYYEWFWLIVIPLFTYWPVSFMQYTLKWDVMNNGLADRYFIAECLQNGYLPFWNPYMKMGTPLFADPGGNVHNPIVWIIGYIWGYNSAAINFEFCLYLVFAAIGMFLLLRDLGIHNTISLVVALVYPLTGFFIGNAQNIACIASAAWLPFIFLYFYRITYRFDWRNILKCAFFSALLVITGYPGYVIIMSYILIVLSIIFGIKAWRGGQLALLKHRLLGYSLAAGVALSISVGYLYSIVHAMALMTRGESLNLEWINFNSFTLQSFVSFILPFVTLKQDQFFGTDLTMRNAYIGLLPFILLCATLLTLLIKRYRFWSPWFYVFLGVGMFGFGVALGDYLHFRSLLYYTIPLMGLFKHPSLFRIFFILGFLVIIGFSLHRAWYHSDYFKHLSRMAYRLIIGGIVLISGILFISILQVESLSIFQDQLTEGYQNTSVYENGIYQGVFQLIVLSVIMYMMLKIRRNPLQLNYYMKLLGVMIIVDLFVAAQFNMPGTTISHHQVSTLDRQLDSLPEGFPVPQLKPIRKATHHNQGELFPIWYNTNIYRKKVAFDAYNKFELKNFQQFRQSPFREKTLQSPLLFLSQDIRPFDKLGTDTSHPHTLYLKEPIQVDTCPNSHSQIQITYFSPNTIRATVQTSCQQVLTLLQNYYPGWRIKVNGEEVAPIISNYTFMSVPVSEGQNQVEFKFKPKGAYIMTGFSGFSLIFVVVVLVGDRIRKQLSTFHQPE